MQTIIIVETNVQFGSIFVNKFKKHLFHFNNYYRVDEQLSRNYTIFKLETLGPLKSGINLVKS